jgi:conjugal transfer ATP-binding protein TraC
MPVVAERQMAASGSPLPTYRNALAFFDMFSESNGATNFNIAVTGTTGAGKSFFIQEILRQVLNAGGFGWVIDMGAVTATVNRLAVPIWTEPRCV